MAKQANHAIAMYGVAQLYDLFFSISLFWWTTHLRLSDTIQLIISLNVSLCLRLSFNQTDFWINSW